MKSRFTSMKKLFIKHGNTVILAMVFTMAPFFESKADNLVEQLIKLQNQQGSARTPLEKANSLLRIGEFYLLKPGENPDDLLSARRYSQAALKINNTFRSDILAADILNLISKIEKESNNKQIGLAKLKQAIILYKKADTPSRHGQALMELRHYSDWSKPGILERIRIVKEAIDCFVRAKDKLEEATAYVELGDIYQLQENSTLAIIALRRAVLLYQNINYKNLQSVYNLMGHIYTATGDLKNGLKYGHLAVDAIVETNDTSVVAATTYNRLAVTYSKLDRLETALNLLQKALTISIRNKWDDGTVQILANIIDLSIKNGSKMNPQITFLERFLVNNYNKITPYVRYTIEEDLRMFFIKSKNTYKSKFYLDKCFQYEQEGNMSFNTHLYYDAVQYYSLIGDFRRAKRYLKKMEVLKDKANDPFISQQYYQVSYKTDSALGNFQNAFVDHQKYKTYFDLIKERKSKYELKAMAARYDLENKDAEIKLKSENIKLLKKDIASQNEIVRRSTKLRNLTIVAISILLLLLISLYSRSHIVKKYSNSIAKKNIYLQKLLNEKEWLIREVHHRVKNNLQMIISLMNSQASYLSNEALDAVLDSKHRIEAMSLIHQKLYLTENTSTVNMQIYIRELMSYLKDSVDSDRCIGFSIDVDEISMDVSHAIPVGLILNEAITNAIKYAFPKGQAGMISISLKYCNQENISLSICDSGVGLPKNFQPQTVSSLGMCLMYGLATEVNGELNIDGNQGTSVKLTFSMPKVFINRSLEDEIVLDDF